VRAFLRFLVVFAAACSGMGQAPGPVPSPRIYVLDGGTLLDRLPVVAYLIVHPRGTLMWEAGTIPDALIEGASTAPRPAVLDTYKAVSRVTLRSQLAKIGYSPEKVTFFAASHYHFDHIANARDFAGATWLVQKAERDAMFGPKTPQFAEPAFYADLRSARTQLLAGDHDVFGDGTVVLKPTPGHTPGHQVLFVKLAKTGPVVLGGDVYHGPEERERPLETVPSSDAPEQAKATRAALEAFVKTTGAAFWIEHDAALFKQQKKSPQFYD
jgi:glyoxylase-like metal-dependent hydrolase (beta-lactamase superfamily II)